MASNSTTVAFEDSTTRDDEMHDTIEQWLADLQTLVEEARASEEFRAWLDVQSRFHHYSSRNSLLIHQQCPAATQVAGYRTWQDEFDRQVRQGESAIWIWAPIIAKRCPECENSRSYHDRRDCEYDQTDPEDWSKGLVGFRPAPVFDVSQTDGEPLPELETAADGQSEGLLAAILEAAEPLSIDVRIIPSEDWEASNAEGICKPQPDLGRPRVEARNRDSDAALAGVLIHEYAHALLHVDCEAPIERPKREVEAEAVAYVVGRHFGLDTSNSAFYLAAWQGEDRETILGRLDRISRTGSELIEKIGSNPQLLAETSLV